MDTTNQIRIGNKESEQFITINDYPPCAEFISVPGLSFKRPLSREGEQVSEATEGA